MTVPSTFRTGLQRTSNSSKASCLCPGFIVYFNYGIKHSSLEESNSSENVDDVVVGGTAGNIELTVTDHRQQQYTVTPDRSIYEGQQLDAFGQPVFGSTNFGGTPNQHAGGHQQQSRQAPASGNQTAASTTASNNLFIDQRSFPTWDD
jgi:cationic amino acid transporter 14